MASSITNIDPSIIKALYESLPQGDQPLIAIKINDQHQIKWEYAVVFVSVIKELKTMLNDYPFASRNAYQSKLRPFHDVCVYTRVFKNFSKFLPNTQDPFIKITEEFLNSMLEALTKDISKFGDQAPTQLFLSFDQWKLHEANSLKSMDPLLRRKLMLLKLL